MSESFEDNLDTVYSTNHQCEDMQIMEEVLNAEKEEFQHMGKSAKFECVFCITSFTRKYSLLRHMRQVHGILQPYQCIDCSKRFAANQTLGRHRRSVCHRNG